MEVNQETNDTPKMNGEQENKEEQESVQAEAELVEEDSSNEENELESAMKKLEQENKELKDKFLRNVADMENLRKRHEKEKTDLRKYGTEKLMEDLLPVLDSFEKALSASDEGVAESYKDGVKMVFKQLETTAEKHGLKGFDSVGEEFDPNLHQGIQRIDDAEVEAETVKDQFQKGYKLNDRLLRPAIVSVLVPSSKE